jgi:hypothetical protein
VSQVQSLFPYPTFSTINYQFSDRSYARYDSMVVKAQKRFSMGFTFLSTLTWSRNYDASSGGAGKTFARLYSGRDVIRVLRAPGADHPGHE